MKSWTPRSACSAFQPAVGAMFQLCSWSAGRRFLIAYQIIAVLAVYLLITAVMNQSDTFILSHQTRLLLSLGAHPLLLTSLVLVPPFQNLDAAAPACFVVQTAASCHVLCHAVASLLQLLS